MRSQSSVPLCPESRHGFPSPIEWPRGASISAGFASLRGSRLRRLCVSRRPGRAPRLVHRQRDAAELLRRRHHDQDQHRDLSPALGSLAAPSRFEPRRDPLEHRPPARPHRRNCRRGISGRTPFRLESRIRSAPVPRSSRRDGHREPESHGRTRLDLLPASRSGAPVAGTSVPQRACAVSAPRSQRHDDHPGAPPRLPVRRPRALRRRPLYGDRAPHRDLPRAPRPGHPIRAARRRPHAPGDGRRRGRAADSQDAADRDSPSDRARLAADRRSRAGTLRQ